MSFSGQKPHVDQINIDQDSNGFVRLVFQLTSPDAAINPNELVLYVSSGVLSMKNSDDSIVELVDTLHNQIIEGNKTLTGTIVSSGSLTVHQQATFNSNVAINGNLLISGSSIVQQGDVLHITDNVITLNDGESGEGVSFAGPFGNVVGIEIDRGTSASGAIANFAHQFLVYSEDDKSFMNGLMYATMTTDTAPFALGSELQQSNNHNVKLHVQQITGTGPYTIIFAPISGTIAEFTAMSGQQIEDINNPANTAIVQSIPVFTKLLNYAPSLDVNAADAAVPYWDNASKMLKSASGVLFSSGSLTINGYIPATVQGAGSAGLIPVWDGSKFSFTSATPLTVISGGVTKAYYS